MCLVVGLGALEAGQKAVVNVDRAPGQLLAHAVAEDLHVAREHHQFCPFAFDDFQLPCFGLGLACAAERDMVKRDVVAGGELVEVAVVADDGANVQRQQPAFPAEQQIIQAMPFAADHQHAAHGLAGGVQAPLHAKGRGEVAQFELQFVMAQALASELHAHEEQAGGVIVVLRGFFDIAVVLDQEAGHRMHDATAVGAGKGQDVGWRHGPGLSQQANLRLAGAVIARAGLMRVGKVLRGRVRVAGVRCQ